MYKMRKMNIEQILNKANFYKRKKLEENLSEVQGTFLDFFPHYKDEIDILSIEDKIFVVCRLIKLFKLDDIDSIKLVLEGNNVAHWFNDNHWDEIQTRIGQVSSN